MSAAFTTAAEDSKKLLAKPSNDELLELYGTFVPYPSTPPCRPTCDAQRHDGLPVPQCFNILGWRLF